MLYGFSGVILQGALVTLELAISSVVLAVIIGLIGAGGKLSQNRLSGLIFEGYTTLIRGVPDLVLMLLIFYGLQIALNTVTEAMGVGQIDIDDAHVGLVTDEQVMRRGSIARLQHAHVIGLGQESPAAGEHDRVIVDD